MANDEIPGLVSGGQGTTALGAYSPGEPQQGGNWLADFVARLARISREPATRALGPMGGVSALTEAAIEPLRAGLPIRGTTPREMLAQTGTMQALGGLGQAGTPQEKQQAARKVIGEGAKDIAMIGSVLAPMLGGPLAAPTIPGALARAGTTFGLGLGGQMTSQGMEGEEVNPITAATRGGLASPAATAGIGLGSEAVLSKPVLETAGKGWRTLGQWLTKTGLGQSAIPGIETEAGRRAAVVRTKEGGKVRTLYPSSSTRYTSAANKTVGRLSEKADKLAAKFDADNPTWSVSGDEFTKNLDAAIARQKYDLTSDATRNALIELRKTMSEKLGREFIEMSSLPGGKNVAGLEPAKFEKISMTDLLRIKQAAGDVSRDLLKKRLAAMGTSGSVPNADVQEQTAREIWSTAKKIIEERGGEVGKEIGRIADRQRILIDVRQHMNQANMRPAAQSIRGATLAPLGARMQQAGRAAETAIPQAQLPWMLAALTRGNLIPGMGQQP